MQENASRGDGLGLGLSGRDAATQGCDKILCVFLCRRSSGTGARGRGLCRGGCSTHAELGLRGRVGAQSVPSTSPSLGPSCLRIGVAAQSRLCSPAAIMISYQFPFNEVILSQGLFICLLKKWEIKPLCESDSLHYKPMINYIWTYAK